jgi:hypothetical protein
LIRTQRGAPRDSARCRHAASAPRAHCTPSLSTRTHRQRDNQRDREKLLWRAPQHGAAGSVCTLQQPHLLYEFGVCRSFSQADANRRAGCQPRLLVSARVQPDRHTELPRGQQNNKHSTVGMHSEKTHNTGAKREESVQRVSQVRCGWPFGAHLVVHPVPSAMLHTRQLRRRQHGPALRVQPETDYRTHAPETRHRRVGDQCRAIEHEMPGGTSIRAALRRDQR